MRSMRRGAFAILFGIAAGCASPSQPALRSSAPITEPPSTAPSVADATPSPTLTEVTPEPTVIAAHVETTNVLLKLSSEFSYTEFMIVVEVTNTGSGWADVSTTNQSYTLSDRNGDLLEQGDFLYVFPREIGPGQKAYYVSSVTLEGSLKKFNGATVDASVDYQEIDGPSEDDPTFSTSNAKISVMEYTKGLRVTGKVKNTSTTKAEEVMVGVVLLGADSKLLGALIDNVNVGQLRPGQTKGFDTAYPLFVAKRSTIKKVVLMPFEFSYF